MDVNKHQTNQWKTSLNKKKIQALFSFEKQDV